MKKIAVLTLSFILLLSMSACRSSGTESADTSQPGAEGANETESVHHTEDELKADSADETTASSVFPADTATSEREDDPMEEKSLQMMIGDKTVKVEWEGNESVTALKELVKEEPLIVDMSMYGGFEQVGSLGASLPREDAQTTTQAGDIVLYSGNQIVVFYGSNSWAYTRLGHITDKDSEELKELLGNGDITLTLSTE